MKVEDVLIIPIFKSTTGYKYSSQREAKHLNRRKKKNKNLWHNNYLTYEEKVKFYNNS